MQESVYLSRTWCLYTWSYLDILITMLSSVNCSTVICSPTIKYLCSWEKPLVKPMAPGSIFHHTRFQSILFYNLYFPIYTTKIPKIFTLLSLLDLTSAGDREGIDNQFIMLVARFLIVCVGTWWLVRCLLLDWYLGSQNWGKYLRYFAASPFPLQGKNQRMLKR